MVAELLAFSNPHGYLKMLRLAVIHDGHLDRPMNLVVLA